MAPRWSPTRSSWGYGFSAVPTPAIILAVILVIAAAGGGFLVGKRSGGSQITQGALSAIVEPTVDGMKTAEANPAGAVKAASSFLVGFPNLAVSPSIDLQNRVSALVAPTADPTVVGSINASINNLRTQLLSTSAQPTGRVIVTPLTYKTSAGTDNTITVTVWYQTVLIDPSVNNVDPRFRAAFNTAELKLAHDKDKGWQLVNFTNQDGPSPQLFTLTGEAGKIDSAIQVTNGSYPYRFALAP